MKTRSKSFPAASASSAASSFRPEAPSLDLSNVLFGLYHSLQQATRKTAAVGANVRALAKVDLLILLLVTATLILVLQGITGGAAPLP